MADAPKPAGPPKPKSQAEQKSELERVVTEMERQNRTLEGLITTCTPENLAKLKAANTELKAKLAESVKELKVLLVELKIPSDAGTLNDETNVLKKTVVAFCEQNNIDPELWKNLESL